MHGHKIRRQRRALMCARRILTVHLDPGLHLEGRREERPQHMQK